MKLISILKTVNKTAFVTAENTYSYQQVYMAVVNTVLLLRSLNIKNNQRMVVIHDHDEQPFLLLTAASVLGLQIIMPYNLQNTAINEWLNIINLSKPDQVLYLKRDLEPAVIISKYIENIKVLDLTHSQLTSNKFSNTLLEITPPIENFLILFSSGTTGNPKAVMISEQLICSQILKVSKKLKFAQDSNVFMSGLMNNTTGIIFSYGTLVNGGTLFFPHSRDVSTWPTLIEQYKITHIMLRPVAMRQFIDHSKLDGVNLQSLKVLAYGAAALPRSILEKGRKLINCEWIQGYGLSETFGPFCWMTEEDHQAGYYKKQVYCIGRSDETLEISLDFTDTNNKKIGELIVKGNFMMQGYYDFIHNKLITPGEWLYTGDYVEFSKKGLLILKGRVTNSVLTKNGHKIYPEEIENIINNIEGVEESVLLSVDYNSYNKYVNGAVICIYTKLNAGQKRIKNMLFNELDTKLSVEKWPDYLCISKQPFPINSNGKVSRAQVKNMIRKIPFIKLFKGKLKCYE